LAFGLTAPADQAKALHFPRLALCLSFILSRKSCGFPPLLLPQQWTARTRFAIVSIFMRKSCKHGSGGLRTGDSRCWRRQSRTNWLRLNSMAV
jgi:hypothetical protein